MSPNPVNLPQITSTDLRAGIRHFGEGKVLDRYLLIRRLGAGGFGEVFLASDERLLGRHVVVKIIRQDISVERRSRNWLLQELKALARLHHPNIVSILDYGVEADGRSMLILEFAPGKSLRQLIPPGGMAMRDIVDVVRQSAVALESAHQHGILHRDVKPDNIMVDRLNTGEAAVKLIDFGIAKIREELSAETQTGEIAGSLRYMAPEQMDGMASAASDQFALALVVFEMLTGRMPVDARTPMLLYRAYMEQRLDDVRAFRPDVPAGAADALRRAFAFDASRRFESAGKFGEALTTALSNGRGNSTGVTHAGRLLPKLCNRRVQEDQFQSVFSNAWKTASALPFVVHGSEGEGHDSLTERLIHIGLRGLPLGCSTKLRNIPWPYEGDLRTRWYRLMNGLAEHFFPEEDISASDLTIERLGIAVSRRQPSLIALSHEIRMNRWDGESERLVSGYVDWFRGIRKTTPMQPPVLLFFKVILSSAPAPSGLFQSIRSALNGDRLSGGLPMGFPAFCQAAGVTLLDELKPVSRDDVMEWFSLYNVLDSEQRRIAASLHLFPAADASQRVPMAQVETFLEWVQRGCEPQGAIR